MSTRWAALPVLLVAVFVTTLDFYVANLAVPSIRADLGAGHAAVQLVVAGYGLAYAAGLIVSGRLGDLYGHRLVFAVGLAVFALASAGCGLAGDAGMLVACRVGQGVAAALLAPQVLALLGGLYQGGDRVRAFGWYGSAVGLAGLSGQVVGGVVVAVDVMGLGWRACFLVNVPICLTALALTPRLLPRTPPAPPSGGTQAPPPSVAPRSGAMRTPSSGAAPTPGPRTLAARRPRDLDLGGAALVTAGLVALVLPLAEGREQGWPGWAWACLAVAPVLLGAFVRRQRRLAAEGRVPLLDLAVFGEKGFVRGLVAAGLLFGTSAGLSFVLALYLQDGLGLAPLAAAAVCTALNAGFFAASLRPGRFGAPVLVVGLALVYHAVGAGPWAVGAALLVTGAGMGLLMSPLLSSVLSCVRPERSAAAAGVLGTVQEAGGVLGGTVTGAVFLAALDGGWDPAARAGLAVLIVASLGVLACSATRAPARGAQRERRPARGRFT
ncbi:MFS transporter [Nonomuraea gerenzanensis]|uniref:Transmembrane efflux protein n=1 Tax=Nonomuraea gerenzanensis TaxID=93944 RepID=A0A1M4DX59_9ACTN|nr:MFS transporter [Nonomuraea gerenzanensis]UBU13508.1 MFS transporter [Nonomuraea gerenzanensis]SBO91169.1 transmembrane efflux protein [Nonomuraea gerenzanensis]